MTTLISELEKQDFENQGYRVVGNHSVVKVCEWTKKSLRGQSACYKCTFYGIQSWRCVEMSPTWLCDHKCVFCWRNTKYAWPGWVGPVDEPKDIIDGCIKEWQKMLAGFGGSSRTDMTRLAETQKPLHFAISLTGEPTMYPKLPEFIDELKSRGITSFLVTNGTIPSMIKKLITHQPTQIYVSVYGPDNETYQKTAMPLPKDSWNKLMETLSMLHKFNRSVVRLTLTKGYNMINPEGYAKLFSNFDFDFLELKGYVWIGHSKERLEPNNMPTHQEIKYFAEKICKSGDFKIIDERAESKVCLLIRKDREDRIMNFAKTTAFS